MWTIKQYESQISRYEKEGKYDTAENLRQKMNDIIDAENDYYTFDFDLRDEYDS